MLRVPSLFVTFILTLFLTVNIASSSSASPAPIKVEWAQGKKVQEAQKDVFAYLTKKVGKEVKAPQFPSDSLVSWALKNYQLAGNDPQRLYTAVYEQLLVVQTLGAEDNPQQKRRALRLTHNANFKVATRLHDTWLSARLFDAFVLPNIEAAPVGKGTLSRARLLQDAASAYRLAGDKHKQEVTLRLLVAVSENDKDIDGADWARVKLADVLGTQGSFAQAAEQLKAVTSINMEGAKRRIPELEAKAKAKAANQTPVQVEEQ